MKRIYLLAVFFCVTTGIDAQNHNITATGNIITVKGYGSNFDGEYDVLKLAKDSCVSGDCESGQGRKILASVDSFGWHIRIMEGKFMHGTFVGDGFMLIDGEIPVFDGTYELGKCKPNYKHNTVGSHGTFHPKATGEGVEGFFHGYYDFGIGKNDIEAYRTYVVCTFSPDEDDKSTWTSTLWRPWNDNWLANRLASPEFKAEQARLRAKYGGPVAVKDMCTCCYGKGTIVRKSFNHALGSGVNYMKYETIPCNCCNGTGLGSKQVSYKPNTDGGANLDYKH
jgi:hypothetical protein